MINFIKKHRKTIIAVTTAIIVPGGLVILFAGLLKKHFGK